jgi:hypothetical protein
MPSHKGIFFLDAGYQRRKSGPFAPAYLQLPNQNDPGADFQVLTGKGYQPFLSGNLPLQPGAISVEGIMAKCGAINRGVDAILSFP